MPWHEAIGGVGLRSSHGSMLPQDWYHIEYIHPWHGFASIQHAGIVYSILTYLSKNPENSPWQQLPMTSFRRMRQSQWSVDYQFDTCG